MLKTSVSWQEETVEASFLKQDTNGSLSLIHTITKSRPKTIYICHATYCDFVAWSEADVVVLHINPCDEFIKSAIEKATEVFKYCILPELLGKWYSKAPLYRCKAVDSRKPLADITSSSSQNSDVTSKKWCFCKSEEAELMIGCDNDCPIQWFHTKCLRINTIPKGKWYFPECRKVKKSGKT